MELASFDNFSCLKMLVGTIIAVDDFPEARKPAFKIKVDFGENVGTKQTSAQVCALYSKEDLLGKQILGLVNIPPRKIANFNSEFLLTGFANEKDEIILAVPERPVPNGTILC